MSGNNEGLPPYVYDGRYEVPPARMFVPGLYRHYKGGSYLALMLVEDSTNRPAMGRLPSEGMESSQAPMVLYVSLDPGPHQGHKCVRDLRQWLEWVDHTGNVVEPTDENAGLRTRRFTLQEERK